MPMFDNLTDMENLHSMQETCLDDLVKVIEEANTKYALGLVLGDPEAMGLAFAEMSAVVSTQARMISEMARMIADLKKVKD